MSEIYPTRPRSCMGGHTIYQALLDRVQVDPSEPYGCWTLCEADAWAIVRHDRSFRYCGVAQADR